jgi:hypothetical protein
MPRIAPCDLKHDARLDAGASRWVPAGHPAMQTPQATG